MSDTKKKKKNRFSLWGKKSNDPESKDTISITSTQSTVVNTSIADIASQTANLMIAASLGSNIFRNHTATSGTKESTHHLSFDNKPTSNNPIKYYFTEDDGIPVTSIQLPNDLSTITSTPQLAYCLSLLNSSIDMDHLTEKQQQWSKVHSNGFERLNSMANSIVTEFIRDELKDLIIIAEVTSLVVILNENSSRRLLNQFIKMIRTSDLLEVNLLIGLGELIRNAPPKYLTTDDLIQILDVLYNRLRKTHQQSIDFTAVNTPETP
jgi:hypothetical protein